MNWLQKANEAGVDGFLHCAELDKLVELATGRDVLEIGSYRGLSAWGMAHTAKSIMCVDTFKAWTNGQTQDTELTTLGAFLDATRGFANVAHMVGTSEEAGRQIRRTYDFIFLDAMHTYEDVKADLERWWPCLQSGGVMALHDYGHWDYPGVQQAADEFFQRPPDEEPLITLAWWKR